MRNSEFENNTITVSSELPFELIPLNDIHGASCNGYKARISGKWIFIKQLKKEYKDNIRYIEAFKKEQEIGITLNHPNLPRYEVFPELITESNWVVTEFIEGETLHEFVKSNPRYFVNSDNVDKFLREMASAIGYLHSRQILHLDIKPANILITRIGHNVKLIDLGFCRNDCFQDTQGYTEDFRSPERKIELPKETDDYYGIGKLLEFLRINVSDFPHGRFKKLERKLLSRIPLDRQRGYQVIASRDRSDNRIPAIIIISSAILLLAAYVGYLSFTNREEVSESLLNSQSLISEDEMLPSDGDKDFQNFPSSVSTSEEHTKNNHSGFEIKDQEHTKKEEYLAEIEDLRRNINKSLQIIFLPVATKIRENIEQENFSEKTFQALKTTIRNANHEAMRLENYKKKYPDLTEDVIADVIAFEMQSLEKELWLDDWINYEKEFSIRKSQAR